MRGSIQKIYTCHYRWIWRSVIGRDGVYKGDMSATGEMVYGESLRLQEDMIAQNRDINLRYIYIYVYMAPHWLKKGFSNSKHRTSSWSTVKFIRPQGFNKWWTSFPNITSYLSTLLLFLIILIINFKNESFRSITD